MSLIVGSSPLQQSSLLLNFEDIITALDVDGWCVVPDFLDDSHWRALADEARLKHADGDFRQAGVGRKSTFQIRPEIRNDKVLWLNPDEPTPLQGQYLDRLEILRQRINQGLLLGLFGFEAHFALYPEGSFYRRHLDQFASARHRTVTCILYLNDNWQPEDGGALRIYIPQIDGSEKSVDIQPQGGSAVFFLSSDFEHEVLPSFRERFSLTGWFYRRL